MVASRASEIFQLVGPLADHPHHFLTHPWPTRAGHSTRKKLLHAWCLAYYELFYSIQQCFVGAGSLVSGRLQGISRLIGKFSNYSDEPAAKTKEAYETIFVKMRNLKALEMQHPSLQEIDFSRHHLIQLKVKSGVLFVASWPLGTCRDIPASC